MRCRDRVFILDIAEMKKSILEERHRSGLSIHSGVMNMYQNLRKIFWWSGMKKEIAEFVYSCLNCQKSKIEHQNCPEWKWDNIPMDFVSGLPRTVSNFEAIWIVMDRLTKSTHFIPMRMDYLLKKLENLYIKRIVSLHGIPSSVVSDRDPRFTSDF